jgi:hypothetical protein
MISSIALYPVFGRPLFIYFGVLAILCFASAIATILAVRRGKPIPFKWHPRLAVSGFVLAVIHGVMAASILLGF